MISLRFPEDGISLSSSVASTNSQIVAPGIVATKAAISVVLPIRNRKIAAFTLKFLEAQLEENDELLISFNQTSKEVQDFILLSTSCVRANIRVLYWDKVKPLYPHWKFIIETASNDLVLFVHDDDVYHGRIVQKVKEIFWKDPEACFVTSQMVNVLLEKKLQIRSDGNEINVIKYDWLSYFQAKKHNGFVPQFNTSFYGMRRSRMLRLDLLEGNPVFGDFVLFHSGLLGGNLYVLPDFLASRLQHGANEVYNEFYKIGHHCDSLWKLFEEAHLQETPEGAFFLNEMVAKFKMTYCAALRRGLIAGVDPRKLVVVARRLRKFEGGRLPFLPCCLLTLSLKFRKWKIWKIHNSVYNFILQMYRRFRGPSAFYKQFPELSLADFAAKLEQPEGLVRKYVDAAYSELGLRR